MKNKDIKKYYEEVLKKCPDFQGFIVTNPPKIWKEEKFWTTEAGYEAEVGIFGAIEGIIPTPCKSHRNGYVYVPLSHPFSNKKSEFDDEICDLDVHGGITFLGKTYPSDKRFKNQMSVFGFDAAHYNDARMEDPIEKIINIYPDHPFVKEFKELNKINKSLDDFLPPNREVRSLEYMMEECEKLASQLKEKE